MSDLPRPDAVPTRQNVPTGTAADLSAAAPSPRIEHPTADVERPAGSATVPGARRDGYTRLPTAPVSVEPAARAAGGADSAVADQAATHRAQRPVEWQPSIDEMAADRTRLAPWALMSAIVALCASFFVGWGIPIAVVSVIAAIMSLRRPVESRAIANWALVLGLCATAYSLGWLVWAGMQFERLG